MKYIKKLLPLIILTLFLISMLIFADKVIINVYEVLNTKGIQKLYEHYIDNIDRQFNLYSFTCLKEKAKNFGDLNLKIILIFL